MKRFRVLLFLAVMLPALLTACGKDDVPDPTETTNDGPTTLWVITENTESDGMNGQAKAVIEKFEAEHQGVEVKLEILPASNEEARAACLDQLRVQIMAGKGPDVFLLPTDNRVPVNNSVPRVEMLFQDVAQAMRNGLFYDISEYYDADEALGKEALKTEVMDAGVVEGSRYVLPLRYDAPILYANTERLKAGGVDMEAVRSGILGYYDTVLGKAQETGNTLWCYDVAASDLLESTGFSLFSDAIDYDSAKVTLTAEEVAQILRKHQAIIETDYYAYTPVEEVIGGTSYTFVESEYSYMHSCWEFVEDGYGWESKRPPVTSGGLVTAMYVLPNFKAMKKELEMIPLRAADGDFVAHVTYYAAVGAGCEVPELAYRFIREFLTEESQWEQNRPPKPGTGGTGSYSALIENGWPVRYKGATPYLWEHLKRSVKSTGRPTTSVEGSRENKEALEKQDVFESDIPILETPFDRVRFPIALEYDPLSLTVLSMNVYDIGENIGAATDVDIDAFAEEFIQKLQWHVAEG